MANKAREIYTWSAWHRFDDDAASRSVPDKPGFYEVRTDFEFGRLKGSSPLVTIGSAATSLRKRLSEQRFGDIKRYLNRAEKWLFRANHTLEFRYATTGSRNEARYMEALKLIEYENEHWELPPGNEDLPLSIIRKQIEQKYGRLTERTLRDLLQEHQLPDKVARILGVPTPVISNLMVYWVIK